MSQKKIQLHTLRLMALLLCMMLVISTAPMAHADGESGSCGSDLSWTLSAGTLTISGSGAMEDFPESTMAPWYPYRKQILRLELPEGLTSVGDLAFYGCYQLTTVVLPDSVKTIGKHAFADCYSIQILNLGKGVTSIDDGAFFNCRDVKTLIFPQKLQSIGDRCCYRMESITTVTIPAGVTSIGSTAFAYCENLINADIQASIENLPPFLFYECDRLNSVSLSEKIESVDGLSFHGCDQLNTVYYDGSEQTTEKIQNVLTNSQVTDEELPKISSSVITEQNEGGTFTQNDTSVSWGENVFVSTNIQNIGSKFDAEIDVTVENDSGWDEACETVEEQLDSYIQTVEQYKGSSEYVNVNIYAMDVEKIDSEFIDKLTKRENVTVTVKTQDGSVWTAESDQQDDRRLFGNYDLRHSIVAGTQELCNQLGVDASFSVRFYESAEINAKVMIRVGTQWKNHTATLFQLKNNELKQHQTALVDQDGYASFYLASVNSKTEYYIAMDLVDTDESGVLEAQVLQNYNEVEILEFAEYEVTGRTSSWGVGLGQVMTVLAVVMVTVIVVVGIIMYSWNKQRLKRGYVPKWDDDDE